jgi:hypothetical protein
MGMLADVHLKAARPGRWIALPNLRGYAAGPDGPVAFISPRSLADGISHWKWDIERLRHLRGRPKYLVTPSDFNDAPRRTELETSARAHGIDILALPVSLEEIDADARKRMELAADYRKPGIETRL